MHIHGRTISVKLAISKTGLRHWFLTLNSISGFSSRTFLPLWNIRKFNTCLPLQPRREELAENGKAYIEKVKTLFAEALETLQRPATMTNEYLNEENAYLHIQGHQIYKLVLQIGTLLCRKANVAFKSDILDKATHTNGYPEIDRVQADLKQITSA